MNTLMMLWRDMRLAAKVTLVIGLATIVAFMIGATFWLSQDSYETLFSDMEARDAAAIVAELDKLKVDYQLAEGGTQIRVPQPLVHDVRLKLMGSGVPLSGGLGFEIFDKSDFGMTEFAQRINYQRALEGELMRTIGSLKEVKYARVHLVIPERGLFQQASQQPTASVTLFLHRERRPEEGQIVGIQRLVASAVPGLEAGQVTVSDQNGITLSQKARKPEEETVTSDRLELKQSVERYLTGKVNEVLLRSFGDSKVLVSIDVSLNFDQVKVTRESVIPGNAAGSQGVLRRRETRSGPAGEGTGNSSTVDVEYQLGRSVEQSVQMPGSITRLSVGVVVPPNTSEAKKMAIRDLVAMSVGIDPARGDAIGVYAINGASVEPTLAVPKEHAALDTNAESPMQEMSAESSVSGTTLMEDLGRYAKAAAAATLFLIIAIWVLSRRSSLPHSSHPLVMSDGNRQLALERVQAWLQVDQKSVGGEVP